MIKKFPYGNYRNFLPFEFIPQLSDGQICNVGIYTVRKKFLFEMEYKGQKYELIPDLSAVFIQEYNNGNEVERVKRASIYTELLGHVRPDNLIVESKSDSPILSPFFRSFLLGYLFKDVRDYGVKRVFFILSEDEYRQAKEFKDKPDFVTHVRSLDEVKKVLAFTK